MQQQRRKQNEKYIKLRPGTNKKKQKHFSRINVASEAEQQRFFIIDFLRLRSDRIKRERKAFNNSSHPSRSTPNPNPNPNPIPTTVQTHFAANSATNKNKLY